MENSNIIKQAKSDIFKALNPIISFYIKKGANPESLKKFYKKNKRFLDILQDINNKGINLIENEEDYKRLVKETLNDILDDFIAKEKDDEYKNKKSKMKHIKEFNSYNENLLTDAGQFLVGGFLVYKFLKYIFRAWIDKLRQKIADDQNSDDRNMVLYFISKLKNIEKIIVSDFSDRFFMRVNIEGENFDIRLLKHEKILSISHPKINNGIVEIPLADDEYNEFLKIIKKV